MIEGFWIVSQGGLCIYSFETDSVSNIDSTLFGGIITAINDFSKEVSGAGLEATKMGDLQILYTTRSKMLFVIGVSQSAPLQKAKKILDQLAMNFFTRFEEIVWTSYTDRGVNTEIFTPFAEEVQSVLKEKRIGRVKNKEDLSDKIKRLITE